MHIRENNDYDIDLNSKANIFEQRIYTVTLDNTNIQSVFKIKLLPFYKER